MTDYEFNVYRYQSAKRNVIAIAKNFGASEDDYCLGCRQCLISGWLELRQIADELSN